MIYFTTLIFTLLLSHIARAMPAFSWNSKYDDPNGNTNSVACSNFAGTYPYFRNFPDFPYIGGSYDTKRGSNCGKCWKLSYKGRSIYFTAIDGYGDGYNIGKRAYTALYGGTGGSGSLDAEAQSVAGHFCGFKGK
ncbi:SnodProt1 [Russula decolorans]